jgi:hypothetical protein
LTPEAKAKKQAEADAHFIEQFTANLKDHFGG